MDYKLKSVMSKIENAINTIKTETKNKLIKADEVISETLTAIDKKTKDKEIVSAQLSDEERKLQEDNDWLSQFREQLQMIERD